MIEVLQARLERRRAPHLGRAQHVERDRQQLEAEEQRHRVLRADEHGHAADRGQQQRVELAVRGLARRDARASDSSTVAMPADAEQAGSGTSRASSTRSAPEMRSMLSSHCQIDRPDERAERGDREQRHERLAHEARAQQADAAARASAPPKTASSGESAAQSIVGPFIGAATSCCRSCGLLRRRRSSVLMSRSPFSSGSCGYSASAMITRDERHEHERVGEADVARLDRRPDAVVHRADEHPQHVDARQHDAGRGDERDDDVVAEDAEQDQELADEVRRAGHRERRQRDDRGTARRAPARGTRCRPCRGCPASRRRARRAARR